MEYNQLEIIKVKGSIYTKLSDLNEKFGYNVHYSNGNIVINERFWENINFTDHEYDNMTPSESVEFDFKFIQEVWKPLVDSVKSKGFTNNRLIKIALRKIYIIVGINSERLIESVVSIQDIINTVSSVPEIIVIAVNAYNETLNQESQIKPITVEFKRVA